jgi:hypothetical protein
MQQESFEAVRWRTSVNVVVLCARSEEGVDFAQLVCDVLFARCIQHDRISLLFLLGFFRRRSRSSSRIIGNRGRRCWCC